MQTDLMNQPITEKLKQPSAARAMVGEATYSLTADEYAQELVFEHPSYAFELYQHLEYWVEKRKLL